MLLEVAVSESEEGVNPKSLSCLGLSNIGAQEFSITEPYPHQASEPEIVPSRTRTN